MRDKVCAETCGCGFDAFCGEEGCERSSNDWELVRYEHCTESFQGAADALFGGVFGAAERFGDLRERFIFEEAEGERVSVFVTEPRDGLIEQRSDLIPRWF